MTDGSRRRLRELLEIMDLALDQARPPTEESLSHDQIARIAHSIWKEQGCPEGRADEHWRLAIERLKTGRLTNFIVRYSIIPALASRTKEGVIREMVASLRSAGCIRENDVEEVILAALRREQLGSTGIGRHIAIPHSNHASIDHLIGTLALSQAGVPFDSIDAEPVYVFVLLVSPRDRPGGHLPALENVVRTMKDEAFVKSLRQVTTSGVCSMKPNRPGPVKTWNRTRQNG